MPYVRELYGHTLEAAGDQADQCRGAYCPHMKKLCDGGGNRDMARVRATHETLGGLFDAAVGKETNGYIPCGVCSLHGKEKDWVVCPRRLLTFTSAGFSEAQHHLAHRVLSLGGFLDGDEVRVWSEIGLKDQKTNVNYRLDYVLRKEDQPPIIVEIMSASTSGGNRAKRTDIQSAFCDAVLYAHGIRHELGNSPGVNIRQVWARMASQMIVKSEIANNWGGRAIWVVQDALLDYIRSNTGLHLDGLRSPEWEAGEVNVISVNINDPRDLELYAGPIRSKDGQPCWLELLSTPGFPVVETLLNQLTDAKVVTTFTV